MTTEKRNGVVLREGIKHIEDLKPQQLLDLLSNWNLDKKNFSVNEKIDGAFMGFGLKDGSFFLRSKNKVWNSPEEIPNIFFLNDFRKNFQLLQNIPLDSILANLSKKYGFSFNGNAEINGEMVPTYDYNIVIYDEKKIGDGIFVIFEAKIEGVDLNNQDFWQDLANEMNKHTSIKVFSSPKLDLSNLEFDNKLIVSLRGLIEKHGNFLKAPARTPEQKELKEKVLAAVKKIGSTAKQQAIQTKFKSLFGDEYEGVILKTPSGELVKIVEKDKFTKRKEQNWHFIDMIIRAQSEFKKTVKANPASIKTSLVKWERELGRIEKDFKKNKDQFITIGKKERDTADSIDYDRSMINKMKDMTAEEAPEVVVDKYLQRKINLDESLNLSESVIKEGGNVFDKTNSSVPKELLDKNIKNALSLYGLGSLKFEVIGNANKPFLGDIDIAVDVNQMKKDFGFPDDNKQFWERIKDFLEKNKPSDGDFKVLSGFQQFHLSSPLIDDSEKQIDAFDKDGNQSEGQPGVIQIDVFVGELNWMKNVLSGAPKDSNFKAVYRNLLLLEVFHHVKWTSSKDPSTYFKLTFSTTQGFKLVKKEILPPEGRRKKEKHEKVSEKLFSIDPNVVSQVLFNKQTTWNDMNSYEKFIKLLKSNKFRFKADRKKILEGFKTELSKRNLAIPKSIQ